MFYSDEVIEEVRIRNDIVDVIGSYVNLKHKGNSYTACCPFHHEKTPSFHVSREKQLYHCFGCGVGGNVISFLMKHENFTFPEAVEQLAERVGYELPKVSMSVEAKRQADERTKIYEMNKSAAAYFHYLIRQGDNNGKRAMEYLKNRGLTDETIDKFGLGYANVYSDDLYQYLKKKGYTDSDMNRSGLVRFDEKRGASDRFWNRVMYPIVDVNNHVIAFGGRTMGDGKPKYINTQDTPVFDKSRNLYGLNYAKKSRRSGIIFCEGYMDVISMHQAGFDNAVASLGTALTVGQVNLIKRYTDRVYLAYDSDEAGTKAALRALEIMREFEMSARVISLKPYKDPDELILAEGTEGFERRIEEAKSGVMFEIAVLEGQYNQNDPQERTQFHRKIAQTLALIQDPIERKNYTDAVAKQYDMDKKDLKEAVTKAGVSLENRMEPAAFRREPSRPSKEEEKNSQQYKSERLLITRLVNDCKLFDAIEGVIISEDFSLPVYREVYNELRKQYKEKGEVSPASIISHYESEEEHEMISQILQQSFDREVDVEKTDAVVLELVRRIKKQSIDNKIAENKDNIEVLRELMAEKAKLGKLKLNH